MQTVTAANMGFTVTKFNRYIVNSATILDILVYIIVITKQSFITIYIFLSNYAMYLISTISFFIMFFSK